MPRIRSLKPELWLSPQVMNLSHSARLMFIGLITQADDVGRGRADLRRLKASIFAGDDITTAEIAGYLAECGQEKLVLLYRSDAHGDLYQLTGWMAHQAIQKVSPSSYPPPNDYLPEQYCSCTVKLPDNYSGIGSERKGKEGKGEEGNARALVDGLDSAAWHRWTVYRTELKKPIKQASMLAAQRRLAGFGESQSAVVEQSIANGWQGLFELKPMNSGAGNSGRSAPKTRFSYAMEELKNA